MSHKTIKELDVRPILSSGTDPFEKIMEALGTIDNEKESLLLINSFEPIPLINKLKTQSYECLTKRPEPGVVHVYITKTDKAVASEPVMAKQNYCFEDIELKYKDKLDIVDVRDLEMPMPMVTILERLEQLEEGFALYVHHKKLPQYLLPELENRSYSLVSKQIDSNNIKLIIFKK